MKSFILSIFKLIKKINWYSIKKIIIDFKIIIIVLIFFILLFFLIDKILDILLRSIFV